MPSSNQKNYLKSNIIGKNFGVELAIGKENITKYVRTVRIIDNISSAWPTFAIGLLIDPNDLILQDIYGKKEMTLVISLNGEDGQTVERNIFHLLYLQDNVLLTPRTQQSQTQAELAPTTFACVPVYAVNLMGSFVNFAWQEEKGITNPTEIIKSYLDKYGFRYEIDDRNALTKEIRQLLVPPMSFNQFIKHIYRHNGLYEGPPLFKCAFDGKFKMWDLSKRATDSAKFTVYQMPAGGESKLLLDKVFKKSNPEKTFVTRDNIETVYHSNANILKHGYDILQVTHPDNSIYKLRYSNMDTIAEQYGIFTETKKLEYNGILRARKKYYYTTSGDRGDDVVNTYGSVAIMKTLVIRLKLRRNIRMKTAFNVGEPCLFEPTVMEHLRYRGKYVLDSVDYRLDRMDGDNWTAECVLSMFRTSNKQ